MWSVRVNRLAVNSAMCAIWAVIAYINRDWLGWYVSQGWVHVRPLWSGYGRPWLDWAIAHPFDDLCILGGIGWGLWAMELGDNIAKIANRKDNKPEAR